MSAPYGAAARAVRVHAVGVALEQVQVEIEAGIGDRSVAEHRVHALDGHRRRGDMVAAVVVTTAAEHRTDRCVLDVRDVVGVGLQCRVGDAPRPRHRIAGAHDLLFGANIRPAASSLSR